MSTFLTPLLAFALCGALHFAALTIFPSLGLLDFPERYGLKRGRIPYPTGILAVITFLFFYTLFIVAVGVTPQEIGILIGVIALATVSFIDDRTPLPSWIRITTQVLIAILIFLTGTRIFSLTNPVSAHFGGSVMQLDTLTIPSVLLRNPSIIGGLFTIVWLGLTMNAMNWFDGVRGQVSALSVVGFLTIGCLSASTRVGDANLALLSFILAGIAAASLIYEFPPPLSLGGDTGAMFFGLMLGVLTIYSGGKVATGFLVFGVPLIDAVFVVIHRLRRGASPFRGNTTDEHLHHRLLKKGWSERQIVLLTTAIGAGFGITALFLSTPGKFLAGLLLLSVMLALEWYSRPRRA